MNSKNSAVIGLLFVSLLLLPVAGWAFFKPMRILLPQFNGVSCIDAVCTEDESRRTEASRLYWEALAFVESSVGTANEHPKVVFCATQRCADAFGSKKRSGFTLGTLGILITPRAWQAHYVRHEMIHHLQNERLGTFHNWLFTPSWFTEGMAYSLSQDPRATLAEPFQRYRSQFDAWYKEVGSDRLWAEAENL